MKESIKILLLICKKIDYKIHIAEQNYAYFPTMHTFGWYYLQYKYIFTGIYF